MPSVLVHPAYFPSIATFVALSKNEVVWESQDNFQKQTYRNRCYICNDLGKHMLTIPIKHVGTKEGRQKYTSVLMDNSYNWKRQHWRTLETAYRTSPFFEFYEDDIRPLFDGDEERLFDFNLKTIHVIGACLDIDISKEKTKMYEVSLVDYRDARNLVKAKKEPSYDFGHYPQVFEDRHGFIPNLSILDLLFNEGPNSVNYLMNQELIIPNV